MTDQLLTIRQMCDLYNVTPRTLRFYETKELLSPIRQGQKRLYTRRDRARLTLILRGKRFGISLEEIRQLLDLYHTENGEFAQLSRASEVGRARLEEMTKERDSLERSMAELQEQLVFADRRLREYHSARKAAE